MKSVLDNLASHNGRLSQRGYILAFAVPFVSITGLTWFSLTGAMGEMSSLLMQGCSLGWLFLLGVGDALNIRRYHDLGHPGRLYRLGRPGLVVLPLLAFVLHFFIPAQMASMGDFGALSYLIKLEFAPSIGPVPLALLLLTFAGVAMNLIYLSLMPGQAGPNDFGPDPRNIAAVPGVLQPERGEVSAESDPVKRALAEYQKRTAQAPRAARGAAPGAHPAGRATFGKKRA